jgi:sulfur relay (sulfurtransferase) complex TusBCD TusD component (DsrE family)
MMLLTEQRKRTMVYVWQCKFRKIMKTQIYVNTPNGYYNIERMLKAVLLKKGKVKLCGSCADARGIKEMKLVEGAELSTMKELTKLTLESDKIVTF